MKHLKPKASLISWLNPKNWFNNTFYSCNSASQLRLFEGDLSTFDKLRLSLHKQICKACESYCHQIEAIDQAYQKIVKKNTEDFDQERLKSMEEEIIKKAKSGNS